MENDTQASLKKKKLIIISVVIVTILVIVGIPVVLIIRSRNPGECQQDENNRRIFERSPTLSVFYEDVEYNSPRYTVERRNKAKNFREDNKPFNAGINIAPDDIFMPADYADEEISHVALIEHAQGFLKLLQSNNMRIATCESATAQMLFNTLAEAAGKDKELIKTIYGGHAVYDTDAKRQFVDLIVDDVYTPACAVQMVEGIFKLSDADFALTVTGRAGPIDFDSIKQSGDDALKKFEEEFHNLLGKVHIGVGSRSVSSPDKLNEIKTYEIRFGSTFDSNDHVRHEPVFARANFPSTSLQNQLKNFYNVARAGIEKKQYYPPAQDSDKIRASIRKHIVWMAISYGKKHLKELGIDIPARSQNFSTLQSVQKQYDAARAMLRYNTAEQLLAKLKNEQMNILVVEGSTHGLITSVLVDVFASNIASPGYGVNVYGGHSFIRLKDMETWLQGKYQETKFPNNLLTKECNIIAQNVAQFALSTSRALSVLVVIPCDQSNNKHAVHFKVVTPPYELTKDVHDIINVGSESILDAIDYRYHVSYQALQFATKAITHLCGGNKCIHYRGIIRPQSYDTDKSYGSNSWLLSRALTYTLFPAKLPDLLLIEQKGKASDDDIRSLKTAKEYKNQPEFDLNVKKLDGQWEQIKGLRYIAKFPQIYKHGFFWQNLEEKYYYVAFSGSNEANFFIRFDAPKPYPNVGSADSWSDVSLPNELPSAKFYKWVFDDATKTGGFAYKIEPHLDKAIQFSVESPPQPRS